MATGRNPLTDEQRAALETRHVPVALSAGAGCGKTFVLTRRFLSYLQPDETSGEPSAHLHEIVAITFTERAAREMRDRIRKACQAKVLEAATDERASYWLSIVRDLESARIMTIHAFCGSLLRSHAVEAGLDPRFAVLDPAQSAALFTEVIDDELRSKLAGRDEATMDLVAAFGLSDLRGMVRSLVGHRDRIDFDAWQGRTPQDVVGIWAEHVRTQLIPAAIESIAGSADAGELLQLLQVNDAKNKRMIDRRAYILEHLPKLRETANPVEDLTRLREHCTTQYGGAAKGWHDPTDYEDIKDRMAALRNQIDDALGFIRFDAADALPAAKLGLQLLEFTRPIVEKFDRRKHELGCLDFDDLLIKARDLLCPPQQRDLRLRIATGIKALLIDEFQDTDPLQVDLVRALCADQLEAAAESSHSDGSFVAHKLFFVGDFKQSIYRFRRADPRVFRQLRKETPEQGRLPLRRNFRSQEQILGFVNLLFADVFGEEYEALESHRGQANDGPCIEFLWARPQLETSDSGGEQPAKLNAEELRALEADWIARRLRQLLDEQAKIVYQVGHGADGQQRGELRPVRPGDIAILFRALSNVALYEQALERYGIDYYLVGGHAFYAQQEIFDLLNVLRALAYPGDLVSLAGALRSPFFSLSDETIFWLAQHRYGLAGGLFDTALPEQLDAQQSQRVVFAASTIRELRACKDRVPVAELIQQTLAATGYDATLLAEFLGERKLANLRKLHDLARSFDASGVLTLPDFITQLSDFVAKQPDEPLAATHPEDTDVVRLMTIHQSKGLEFPVVVVPDLNRKPPGAGSRVAFDPVLGPLAKPAGDGAVTGLSLFNKLEDVEEQAERHRLFYVATTRAADYLILSCGTNIDEKPGGPWMKLLSERFDLENGKLLEECQQHGEGNGQPPRIEVAPNPPEPKQLPRARRPQLERLIEQAAEAVDAQDFPPLDSVRPVPVDAEARREFSFSRLSSTFHAEAPRDEETLPESAAASEAEAIVIEGDVATFPDESGPASPQGGAADQAQLPRDAVADPRGLGTLVHAVLEGIEFSKPPGPVKLEKLVQGLAGEYLGEGNPHAVETGNAPEVAEATDMLKRFLASPRAKTLAAASQIENEIEFLLAWPPEGTEAANADGLDSQRLRYFRGFIDCLYQDAEGRWHLLDYKTNRVTEETLEAVAEHYEMQMFVYSLAVEQVLRVKPASATLYFLRPGKEFSFTFTDQDRARMIQRVNRGMADWVREAASV